MKLIRNITFLATAVMLSFLLQTSTVLAGGKPQIEVTFAKWVTVYPAMEGVVGGDLGDGLFAGEVLGLDVIAGGKVWKIKARYEVIVGDRSVTAIIHGTLNWQTGVGTLNGFVTEDTEGSLTGARVHVRFDSVPNSEHGFIYPGTITIMPN